MSREIIHFDWAIKNILRDKANFGVLEGFLHALLKKNIKIEQILDSESNKIKEDEKSCRVDVLAINDQGEHIIIEVQYAPEKYFFKRLLYGVSRDIVDNLKIGESYDKVVKVISVCLVHFLVEMDQITDYVYKIDHNFKSMLMDGNHNLNIFPEYYIISLEAFKDIVKDDLDQWIYALKNNKVEDDFNSIGIEEMKEKLMYLNMSYKERKEYDEYLKSLSSMKGVIEYRDEETFNLGHEAGHKDGDEEEKKIIALNLLKEGSDTAFISKVTSLPIEVIELLQEEI